MNKLLLVLLAVCLVSVHAFVRREAPASDQDVAKDLQNQLQDLGKQLEGFVNQENIKKGFDTAANSVKETFDSEAIKKQLGGLIDTITQAVQGLSTQQSKEAPQKN